MAPLVVGTTPLRALARVANRDWTAVEEPRRYPIANVEHERRATRVTSVKLAHLRELREALAAAYVAAGRGVPVWTDAAPAAGPTPIIAAHLTELRAAAVALESRGSRFGGPAVPVVIRASGCL